MAMVTTATLIDTLRQHQILEPEQLAEVTRTLQVQFPEPRDLARELMKRGWLSAYQLNLLMQGRGGELVLGSYVLQERIGEGGMGQVFKARHQKMGRLVAVKVIRKEKLSNPDAVRRFQREIRTAAQLNHVNVVMALDAAQVGDTHLFVMEYVDGTDLAGVVKQRGPLPVAEACNYVLQAAHGLHHAFERGLVHRDIKPSNLLLTSAATPTGVQPVVKLLDLGLARAVGDTQAQQDQSVTGEGIVLGTPQFMAPEQSRDSRSADIRADLYSLGCTLYFLLAGRPPFQGETATDTVLKHHLDAPPEVTKLRPDVPSAVAGIIRKLMAKRPEDRYQAPAELIAALEAVLLKGGLAKKSGLKSVQAMPSLVGTGGTTTMPLAGIQAPVTSRLTQILKRIDRRWLVATIAACTLLFGLIALSIALLSRGKNPLFDKASPLDQLSREAIPQPERLPGLPQEVVAVLGEQRAGHITSARGLARSPDGNRVVSVGDRALRIWDANSMRLQHVFMGQGDAFTAAAFSADGKLLVAGDAGGQIWQWEVASFASKEPTISSALVKTTIRLVAFSSDGKQLHVVGQEGSYVLWNLDKQQSAGQTQLQDMVFGSSLAVSSQAKYLAVGRTDGKARLWNLQQYPPTVHADVPVPGKHISSLEFSSDEKTLAIGCTDGVLLLWNVAESKLKNQVDEQKLNSAIGPMAFVSDEIVLCSCLTMQAGQFSGLLVLVDLKKPKGEPLASIPVAAVIPCLTLNPKNQTFVFGCGDGTVQFWSVAKNKLTRNNVLQGEGHNGYVTSTVFMPDGKALVTGSKDGTVRIWDLIGPKFTQRMSIPAQKQGVTSVAISPNGKLLASAGEGLPVVQVWELSEKASPRRWTESGKESTGVGVAFSPDGKLLASGGKNAKEDLFQVRVWDLSGNNLHKVKVLAESPGNMVISVAFSPDSKRLAAGGLNHSVRWWDLDSDRPPAVAPNLGGFVMSVAFAPDGKNLAFSAGKVVSTWNLDELVPRKPPVVKHRKQVGGVAWSQDGKTIASVGHDGQLILWDAATLKDRFTWQFPAPLYAVAFAPDGRHLALASETGATYILRLAPEHLKP